MKSDCQDVTFIIDDITKDDTGDYSCVFSSYKYDPEDVRGNGINSIFITVNGKIFKNRFFFCFLLPNHMIVNNNAQICIYFNS